MSKKSALGIFLILSALIHIGLFSLRLLPSSSPERQQQRSRKENTEKLIPAPSEIDFQIIPPVAEQQTIAEPPKEPEPKKKETPAITKKKHRAPAVKDNRLQKKKVDELIERPISDLKRSGPGSVCDDWYGGIGVTINLTIMRIIEVFPDYPAWRTGLRVGDQILGVTGNESIKGEPGTLVELTIQRGEDVFKKIIKRERICYLGRNPSI